MGGEGTDATDGLLAHVGAVADVDVNNPAVGPGPYLGLTTSIRKGQSGGPVVDRWGRAVGVVTWTWRDRPGGFAIPIGHAAEMLAERPSLEDTAASEARAGARAESFVAALRTGDFATARNLAAPSHARKVRAETLDEMMNRVPRELLISYVDGLESLVDRAESRDQDPFEDLAVLAGQLGSDESLQMLGLEEQISGPQAVTFFFELGQAYLAARVLADRRQEEALEASMRRLFSLDAARSFALADVVEDFAQPGLAVEEVTFSPGAYGPRAVARVRVPAALVADASGVPSRSVTSRTLALQMRVEWGDWYVADVQVLGPAARLARR